MGSHPAHELATVINNFLSTFNTENKLPAHKLRTLSALQKCRTEYMGGHIEVCEDCGEVRDAYNSCRNRHCPKCGAIEKEKWIMNREADLLPVKYFHVVFTVPDKLNSLFLNNQVAMYNILFSVVWDVMKGFGKTKKWIGGLIGVSTENYKIKKFHNHIEAGQYLLLVDVSAMQKPLVESIVTRQFTSIWKAGEDTTVISPFEATATS